MPVDTRTCERNQAAWNEASAVAGGGACWEDAGLRWSWQAHDGQLMLNFPTAIDGAAVRRGLEAARDRGAHIVGAWLGHAVDPAPLEAAGFERGWEPCWMAAPAAAIPADDDARVTLDAPVPEYDAGGQRLLTLAADRPPRAWHAVARVDGRFAGRGWTYLDGRVAGVYDMDVWPAFRRQGLGRALLRAGAAAAREAGAGALVLNATPDGERLYRSEGFTRVGRGVTYWHHFAGR